MTASDLSAALPALLAAARQIAQQRACLRSMGVSARRDGIAYADSPDPGPALDGLWRPLIVVPSDFDRRYTAAHRSHVNGSPTTH